jgi:putative hydrolase of the HAD superfamily
MTFKYELILDVAGVLVTNFSPFFWQELSIESAIRDDLLANFQKEIREELWSGKISEDEFWRRLCDRFPSIKKDKVQISLRSYIKPLPALEEVSKWCQFANIHLLSNHRMEWIQHILNPISSYVKSITISSQVGCCKPNHDIYSIVRSYLFNEQNVLFVDDQEKNFKAAKNLGWNTLLADDKGDWIQQVTSFLQESSL